MSEPSSVQSGYQKVIHCYFPLTSAKPIWCTFDYNLWWKHCGDRLSGMGASFAWCWESHICISVASCIAYGRQPDFLGWDGSVSCIGYPILENSANIHGGSGKSVQSITGDPWAVLHVEHIPMIPSVWWIHSESGCTFFTINSSLYTKQQTVAPHHDILEEILQECDWAIKQDGGETPLCSSIIKEWHPYGRFHHPLSTKVTLCHVSTAAHLMEAFISY